MNKRWIWIAALLLAVAALLIGCSSGKKPESHTKGYDTEENLAAFQASGLFALAEGYCHYRNSSYYETSRATNVDDDELGDAAAYRIDPYAPATTPLEPFVAVAVRTDDEKNETWSVCGGSAKAMDLENLRTLAVCVISERRAQYEGDSRLVTGTTEDARILYIDARTGRFLTEGELRGKDLPNRSSGGAPEYTLSNGKLVDQVVKDMTPPYTLTDEGEVTGGKLVDMQNGYAFPDNVRRITKLELGENVDELTLPASVEAIAEDAIPRACATQGNLDKPVVLIVEPGSCAETFARQNGYPYRHPGEGDDAERVWVAGSECAFYSTGDHSTIDYRFPIQPDGDLAAFLTLQKRSYKGKDARTEDFFVLIVEAGGPAEAYAQAHQYLYCHPGEEGKRVCRFCVDGREWCVRLWNHIVIPDGVAADDAVLAWALEEEIAKDALVDPNSPAAEACRAAGLKCWTGDVDRAERAFETEDGLAWRVVYSFAQSRLLAVHIPGGYVQTGSDGAPAERMNMLKLLEGIGFGDGLREPDRWPLCWVQPGSWAAEAANACVEEGTTVLRMRDRSRDYVNGNGRYISEYVCDAVTEVVDANFEYYDREEAERMLLDRGVKPLYTSDESTHYDMSYHGLVDQPEKLYLIRGGDRWHLNNGRLLEGVEALRLWDDPLDDAEERSWILERARQDAPFHMEVVEGTAAEAFAKENDIPFELWDPQTETLYGEARE